MNGSENLHKVRLVRVGIDTYQQPVVYMRADCHLCRAEGFKALSRIQITTGERSVIATLNVVDDGDWLHRDTAGLSEAAWAALQPGDGEAAWVDHAEPPASTSLLRAKVFGRKLTEIDYRALIGDIAQSRYSDLELAAFVTACAGERLDQDETTWLTKAMVAAGERIDWGTGLILDKHCVGGLPGNRTTPIVVAIVAAAGHRIPKTSSRAITSPAGTADTMEAMAPVDLDLPALRKVVEQEGGCIVWGGKMNLSPADDILIRVERPLDFDSDGQMVASVLSKKAAAGASHVVIDMPVGPTAKVRSQAVADALTARLSATAAELGLKLFVARTDGSQPVGFGIGPALEARDVLAVLRNEPAAPQDLRERAIVIAGALLDLAPGGKGGTGCARARVLLETGQALAKFLAICEAQGGFREPEKAAQRREFPAPRSGWITAIDNRRLAKVAKLSGAPLSAEAGLILRLRIGDEVMAGQPLFEVHANAPGELDYAFDYANAHPDLIGISG